ncbi:MAG: hypothetical protein ATN33_06635 [Epulopiscium sp. Nele67-Bin001]|nr:MAG: hypothetical protein BEN18_06065 [Epulopiscium sp. Nuni2H_MBin001]OON92791.1 MAG: hypothetical protein ATN33_06635 [Epulopiscium sp. Nele67-Bin001]
MQKKIALVIAIWISLVALSFGAEILNADDIIKVQLELFDWDGIDRLEQSLASQSPQLENFDLQEEVMLILSGQKQFSLQSVLNYLLDALFGEIYAYISIIVRFILIIVLCHILNNLSTAFESKNTTKVAFFVCNIVVFYSVAQSLVLVVELAHQTIDNLTSLMLVILPTLLAFMATSGYIATSAALSPVIVSGLTAVSFVIQYFLLPSVVGIIILQMVSSMSDEFKIDKFIGLFYKYSKSFLKLIFVLSMAIMGIYKMSLPYVDVTLKRVGLTLSAKFIPILGDAVSGAIDLIIQMSGMIKNAFGIGVILWIVILIAMPLVKMFTYILLYHFAGAIIEPLGDKRMAKMATDIAKGCEFVMSCVGVVAILCIVALVICMSIGASLL